METKKLAAVTTASINGVKNGGLYTAQKGLQGVALLFEGLSAMCEGVRDVSLKGAAPCYALRKGVSNEEGLLEVTAECQALVSSIQSKSQALRAKFAKTPAEKLECGTHDEAVDKFNASMLNTSLS